MQTSHTYLLQPGTWRVTGTYYDAHGRAFGIVGESRIEHHEEQWLNQNEMSLTVLPPLSFCNLYEIEPMEQGLDTTIWETHHARLGLLMGTLAVVGDALIMSYTAVAGQYAGNETLAQQDANHYRSWGVLWEGDQKISSWTASLERLNSHGA
ncbi:MAG: hypothetical protein ACO1RX_17190 [Candidatus Sericytochromatia bacterium]